jgi:hypothetical protein
MALALPLLEALDKAHFFWHTGQLEQTWYHKSSLKRKSQLEPSAQLEQTRTT